MINLSDEQKKIVNYDDGPLLVKAGPGSGKTRVLIERIKRLLLTKPRTRILALTFSNMAAEEMKTRIQEDAQVEELIDNVNVGTIHSFCLDLVQSRGYLLGLPHDISLFESLDDRKKILSEVLISEPTISSVVLQVNNKDAYLTNCLSLISDYKKHFKSPTDPDIDEMNSIIYKSYNEQLLAQGAIDFDDILFYAYRILAENPSVVNLYNKQYNYICVDESQDLNFAQYSVIKALCGNSYKNIMLVGDENQSIYGFNGSDSELMSKQFVADFSPKVFYLNENFRSAKSIVNFANTLESSSNTPNCHYDGELKLYQFQTEEEEAAYIINKIHHLLEHGHPDIEGKLTYESFAIIARNKYVFSELEKQLIDSKVPYCFKKTSTGIESESELFQAFDLELRLIANPKDILHARELDIIKTASIYPTMLSSVHDIVSNISPEDADLKRALSDVRSLNENSSIDEHEKYMIFNDYNLWCKHWNKYISQVPSGQRTLASFRNYVSLGKTQTNENDSGIALMTAHMSKGLQYEVVFVMGLCEGTFPDYRAVQVGGKSLEQEQNNMYVAVTRAKRLCYLTYPKIKLMPWGAIKHQKPSQFLSYFKIN